MEGSDGELLKQPFFIALVAGTLLEAFGGMMYSSGGVYANPGWVLFAAGIGADLIGVILWFKTRR